MQVRSSGRTRAADLRDLLPASDLVTGLDRDAARGEMGVDGEAPIPEIEYDAVSARGIGGHILSRFADVQIGIPIDRLDNGGVPHGDHRLAIGGEAGVE